MTDEAKALVERLMEYAGRADDCQIMKHGVWSDPIPCTCGYSEIAEALK